MAPNRPNLVVEGTNKGSDFIQTKILNENEPSNIASIRTEAAVDEDKACLVARVDRM